MGVGAVLMQANENGVDYPVSFFFKRFNLHQPNNSMIEKEALALILAMKHFEVYVGG